MTALTDDMTRLWGEIERMRGMRAAFINQLEHTTRERRNAISAMRADFAHAHAEMARATKVDRMTLISSLKRAVAGQQQGVKRDLSGALRAWSGPTPVERDAMESQQRMCLQAETQTQEKLIQRKPAQEEQEKLARAKRELEKLAKEKLSRKKLARKKLEEEERLVHLKTQAKKRKKAASVKEEGANATNERRSARSNSGHSKGSNRQR